LRALLAVRRPDTGEPLRAVGCNGTAVAAIDATFSAPKTVSAVWAIADPGLREQLEAAHEAAVDMALGYAVGRVAMIRERRADRSVVHTAAVGVVATSWRHTTARAVAGQLPDPQLHSHVLLHGAVRRDGKVMAIDSRAWLLGRREVAAALRSHLAGGLNRLGFDIRRGTGRDGRYFEIAGIPDGLVERWSSRERQIQAAITARLKDHDRALTLRAAAGGPDGEQAAEQLARLKAGQVGLTPKQNRSLIVATRSAKQPTTHIDLDRSWQTAAASFGLTPARVREMRAGREPLAPAGPDVLLRRLTASDAMITAQAARATALEASAGASVEGAVDQLRALQADVSCSSSLMGVTPPGRTAGLNAIPPGRPVSSPATPPRRSPLTMSTRRPAG
jgi:conjugative relaxase-like TrwC/TraI family protein